MESLNESLHQEGMMIPDVRQDLQLAHVLMDHIGDMVAVCDRRGQVIRLSASFTRLLGHQLADIAPATLIDYVHPEDVAGLLSWWNGDHAAPVVLTAVRLRATDGQWHALDMRMIPIRLGDAEQVVAVGRHAAQPVETQLLRHARYDIVTGLPNRALFMERLDRAIQQMTQPSDEQCAVLFLDIDRFKVVNDRLGHTIGDQLLRAIVQRLTACLRPRDTLARLGGDEFGVLLNGIAQPDAAVEAAANIHQALVSPFYINRHEIVTSASIGIAISEPGYTSSEQLLRDADTALHRAKTRGKGRSEVFDRVMHLQAIYLAQLEAELRSAIWHEVLQLHYQPIVSVQTGRIIGVEALVRWHHPTHGFVSPAEFIPLAEETALIVPIGEWVLRTACKQAKAWQDLGLPRVYVAVNLSARQFRHTNVPELVRQVLDEVALLPECLKLELTESSIMEDADLVIPALQAIKAMGVELAMDDFGTGYSSLSYLKRLPMTTLKIDRSFVNDIAVASQGAAIVRAAIVMAHSLGLAVVAEGVETEDQAAFLSAARCEAIQGYLCSPPVASDAMTLLLQDKPALLPARNRPRQP